MIGSSLFRKLLTPARRSPTTSRAAPSLVSHRDAVCAGVCCLRSYTVRVPERDYTSIPERLRALSAHRVRQLATNAHMVYETCFDTPVATAVAVLRNRLATLAADE